MLKDILKPFRYPRIELPKRDAEEPVQRKRMNTQDIIGTLKRIWYYLSMQKGLLVTVLLLVVLSSGLALLGPYLVGIVAIDHYIMVGNRSGFVNLLFVILGVYLLYSFSMWLQNYLMIGIAQHTVYTMRKQLFDHLHKLPIRYFDQRQHGELMSRLTNDIENVSSTLNSSVIQIFSSLLILIGSILFMLYLSPLLTLITFLVVPLMFLGMRWITRRTGPLFKEVQRHLGDLNGFIEETVSGQRIVKTFSQEERVINEFLVKSERLKGAGFWAQAISGFIPKLMNGLNNLNFAIIAGIGGLLAYYEWITIGVIVVFAELTRQFTRPLNDLANQFNTLLSAVAGAERVFAVIDEKEEEQDERNAEDLDQILGEVEFRNVSFSYEQGKGDRDQTVTNICFYAAPGQTIAFVGPTGAGKTTMINLLSRFYDPDVGQILIDGYDIKRVTRQSLRKHMAFVLQDTFLFEGTIRENIRYGRLDASDQEVIEAAQQANAHSFIMKLPKQYDTVLNQDGSGISQGQKQLLSIARAILADPTILILDEATSSIDTVTELKIQEALQRLMAGRTCFVIAHRLNTIRNADQIVVLLDGRVAEQGSHEELLRQNGFYHELYSAQWQKQRGYKINTFDQYI